MSDDNFEYDRNRTLRLILENKDNPEFDENKPYDIEQQDFVDELGNNGEELKNYPDEDPLEEDRNYGR